MALTTSTPWLVVGISRSAWFRLRADGLTPELISLGVSTRRPLWRIADLEAWVNSRGTDQQTRPAPRRKAGKAEVACV